MHHLAKNVIIKIVLCVDNFLTERQVQRLINQETSRSRASHILKPLQISTSITLLLSTVLIIRAIFSHQLTFNHFLIPTVGISIIWLGYYLVKYIPFRRHPTIAHRIYRDLPRIYRYGLKNQQTFQPIVSINPSFTPNYIQITLDIYVKATYSESFIRRALSHYQQELSDYDPTLNFMGMSGTEHQLYRQFRFLRWKGSHQDAYAVYQEFQVIQEKLYRECHTLFSLEEHILNIEY